ncbi:DUF1365 domain-containing protein [Nibricoccus aquaticus]|uniref:DUF1365 domain-containing protein n=1 Tax=Nibricoccus aquaticus TaxID=2576891 RepID=A0A290QCE0_9BACT|nr:DUF1365 domain-containing protein [Nibricoccus aquaticus]ATC63906.1 DUF1365 domain-containing protein [Nibricoccus aquaticus]
MQSCLYECRVMHHRFTPKAHRFAYRIFMMAIDLDELPDLHRRLRLFSVNRPNLYSFREGDHLPATPTHNPSPDNPAARPQPSSNASSAPPSLKARVLAHLAAHGIDLTGGRVLLVSLPRILGYLFKPVSFYFCYDRHGHPVAALAEVTNTFHELKPYTLGPETRTQPEDRAHANTQPPSVAPADASPSTDNTPFRLRVPKHFYVSPFSDVDIAFDFTLRPPTERLSVQIDDYEGNHRTLTTTLAGPRRPLTDAALASYLFKYPLLTLRVITLIHWHALRLWLKRVPWFAKSARPADQRDLHHPHASLTAPSSPSEVPPLRPSALPR